MFPTQNEWVALKPFVRNFLWRKISMPFSVLIIPHFKDIKKSGWVSIHWLNLFWMVLNLQRDLVNCDLSLRKSTKHIVKNIYRHQNIRLQYWIAISSLPPLWNAYLSSLLNIVLSVKIFEGSCFFPKYFFRSSGNSAIWKPSVVAFSFNLSAIV